MRSKTKRAIYAIVVFVFVVMARFYFTSSTDDVTTSHHNKNERKLGANQVYHVTPDWAHWKHFATFNLPSYPESNCPKNEFKGRAEISLEVVPLDKLREKELSYVKKGGWWHPKNCDRFNSTAVVIPYNGERPEHLSILLRHLHPILTRQNLNYRVFVVQQVDGSEFNAGKLKNIGFAESLKNFPFSCVVFHDVDIIPEDDRIQYGCLASPMHLSSAIMKHKRHLPHPARFGDVQMITPKHFINSNGFSNIFYTEGGGEDEEMSRRLSEHSLLVHRLPEAYAKYKLLIRDDPPAVAHRPKRARAAKADDLMQLMRASKMNWENDGLSSLQYDVHEIRDEDLYTLIRVDLQKGRDDGFGVKL